MPAPNLLRTLTRALKAGRVTQAELLTAIAGAMPQFPEAEALARGQCSDELEIDADPLFSRGDDGCWVSAWVWVPLPDEEDC